MFLSGIKYFNMIYSVFTKTIMEKKQNINTKYHQLKLKKMLNNSLTEKEQGFVLFYENNVLKYGLSHEDRSMAMKQAEHLFNNLFKD